MLSTKQEVLIMKLVNESRLFKSVLPYIGNQSRIVEELVENAVRANASSINIDINGDTLTAINDGDVLEDWFSLFRVASTGYDADTVKKHKPAGMGVMMMLAASTKAVFKSGKYHMAIESEKFFACDDYRDEVHQVLEYAAMHESEHFINGMEVVLTCDPEFLESIVKGIKKAHALMFAFYPLNIVINDNALGNKKLDWALMEQGRDQLSGCEVGIANDTKGAVIWHGKYIECKDIYPFTVNVTDEFSLLSPNLPDRVSISNPENELVDAKNQIETQLFDAIQNALNETDGRGNIFGLAVLGLLANLNHSFDVKHFEVWGHAHEIYLDYQSSYLTVFKNSVNEVVLYESATNFVDQENNDLYIAHEESECLKLVSPMFGGTSAPQWVLDNLKSKIVVELGNNLHNVAVGVCTVSFHESLFIGGKDANDCLFYNDDNYVLASDTNTIDVNSSVFIYNGDQQCSNYEFDNDLADLKGLVSKKVSYNTYNSFFNHLEGLSGIINSKEDIQSIEFNRSDEVSTLTLVSNKGEKEVLEVANSIY